MGYATILKGGAGSGKKGHKTIKDYAKLHGYRTNNKMAAHISYETLHRTEGSMFTAQNKAHNHLIASGFTHDSGKYEHPDGTKAENVASIEHTKNGFVNIHKLRVERPGVIIHGN